MMLAQEHVTSIGNLPLGEAGRRETHKNRQCHCGARTMLISFSPQSISLTQTSQTSQAVASADQTTPSPSPAVINDITQSGGGMSAIITAEFVQKSVDSTNLSIVGYNNIDWSRFHGLTQQQLQAAEAHNAKQYQAEEQGIVAMASYMGVTGVNLTFTQVKGQATSEDGTSPGADDTQAVVSQQSDSNPAVLRGSLSEPTTSVTAPPTPKVPTNLAESVLAQSQTFPGGASVTAAPANPANNFLTSADAALALLTAAQKQSKPSAGTSADLSKTADLRVW